MTRQFIICSALIASVAAPALAGTVTVTNRAGVTREISPAAFTRTTNLAGSMRATNPAEWLRHPIPVDIIPRVSNPAMLDLRVKASDAAALFRASNPASVDRLSNPASAHRRIVHPDMIMLPRTNPVGLFPLKLVCWSNAAARDFFNACERIVRDPPMPLHRVGAQARVDLSSRKVILRPMPGRGYGQFGTTSSHGGVDNQ